MSHGLRAARSKEASVERSVRVWGSPPVWLEQAVVPLLGGTHPPYSQMESLALCCCGLSSRVLGDAVSGGGCLLASGGRQGLDGGGHRSLWKLWYQRGTGTAFLRAEKAAILLILLPKMGAEKNSSSFPRVQEKAVSAQLLLVFKT